MKHLFTIGLCLWLAACGDDKPPQKTVFEPQVQALKKARAVDQKVQDAAQQQREQIDDETQQK